MKRSGCSLILVSSSQLSGKGEEPHEKSKAITDIRTDISTRCLKNMKRYWYQIVTTFGQSLQLLIIIIFFFNTLFSSLQWNVCNDQCSCTSVFVWSHNMRIASLQRGIILFHQYRLSLPKGPLIVRTEAAKWPSHTCVRLAMTEVSNVIGQIN